MNYFLLLVIVGVCGGSYYMYSTDQEQITTLQQQVNDLTAQLKTAATGTNAATTTAVPTVAPVTTAQPAYPLAPATLPATSAPAIPANTATPHAVVAPVPLAVVQPDHLNAVDAAANAAIAASNGSSLGTISTLDHKTYTNCKVLKVEKDGVTFSHDDGITKILYPMMPPDVQKQFGYTPQGAVAQTEAELRAEQQAAAATNGAPAP